MFGGGTRIFGWSSDYNGSSTRQEEQGRSGIWLRCLLDVALGMCFGHLHLGGDLEADPGHILVSSQRKWLPCWDRCPRPRTDHGYTDGETQYYKNNVFSMITSSCIPYCKYWEVTVSILFRRADDIIHAALITTRWKQPYGYTYRNYRAVNHSVI